MDKPRRKHAAYALLACGMLVYGAVSFKVEAGWGWQNGFAALWSLLALLVLAAQLVRLFMSKRTEERLERVRRVKRAAWERRLTRRLSP